MRGALVVVVLGEPLPRLGRRGGTGRRGSLRLSQYFFCLSQYFLCLSRYFFERPGRRLDQDLHGRSRIQALVDERDADQLPVELGGAEGGAKRFENLLRRHPSQRRRRVRALAMVLTKLLVDQPGRRVITEPSHLRRDQDPIWFHPLP